MRANDIGNLLTDYVDGMLEIAKLRRVPCLDLFRTLDLTKGNYMDVTFDGTHPNGRGAALRAEAISGFIKASF